MIRKQDRRHHVNKFEVPLTVAIDAVCCHFRLSDWQPGNTLPTR